MLTPALNILHLAHTERKARKQTSKMEEDREETRLHHCCDINSNIYTLTKVVSWIGKALTILGIVGGIGLCLRFRGYLLRIRV